MELKTISNNDLTLLRKLNRKKYRQKEQLFFIEGQRSVQQLINNEVIDIKSLYFDESQTLWREPFWQQKANQLGAYAIEARDFLSITDTESPQGILALCHIPAETDISLLASKPGIIIAVDAIQDPGNLGTMIRAASWFGVEGLLAGKGTVDCFHPKVVRSTAGATGSIPYLNADLENDLAWLEQAGWTSVLLDAGSDAEELRTIEVPEKAIIVVGNEANGINAHLMKIRRLKGCIPSFSSGSPKVESLNASIALSIALYAFSSANPQLR